LFALAKVVVGGKVLAKKAPGKVIFIIDFPFCALSGACLYEWVSANYYFA
jgi:hypothetical protein